MGVGGTTLLDLGTGDFEAERHSVVLRRDFERCEEGVLDKSPSAREIRLATTSDGFSSEGARPNRWMCDRPKLRVRRFRHAYFFMGVGTRRKRKNQWRHGRCGDSVTKEQLAKNIDEIGGEAS